MIVFQSKRANLFHQGENFEEGYARFIPFGKVIRNLQEFFRLERCIQLSVEMDPNLRENKRR